MTNTNYREVGPTADDWLIYGKKKPRRVAKPVRAANDNRLTADRVSALVQYRNEPDHPYEPLQSSWSVTPSGIVETEDVDESDEQEPLYRTELELEISPTVNQILMAMRGDWTWYTPALEYEGERVSGIGKLRFANGKQRERMMKTGPDGKVGAYMAQMPAGAMLGTSEKQGAPKGGSGESPGRVTISNQNLTQTLLRRDKDGVLLDPSAPTRQFIPKGKMRPKDFKFTAAESRENLAKAIANTAVMPPVIICPPGIASGTEKYSDQFIGMKVLASGKSGAISWVDFYVAGRDREEWLDTLEALSQTDKQVLEAALSAEGYADVGIAAGQSPEYARSRGGKMILTAANDNLEIIIKKAAA